MNAVSKALVTCSGTSQLKNQSSASAKEFAKKYVDNLDQVPQMRPSHSLLARNLHEYQEDPKLKADIQDATAQLLSVNGFSIKSNFSAAAGAHHLKCHLQLYLPNLIWTFHFSSHLGSYCDWLSIVPRRNSSVWIPFYDVVWAQTWRKWEYLSSDAGS